MKKKIGLYLSEQPFGGGKFQYSLCILDAISTLPIEEYEIVVGYANQLWLPYLRDHNFRHFHVSRSIQDRIINRIWSVMRVTPRWMQRLSPRVYSPAKKLLQEHLDLWIFPSHEPLTYQTSLPSLSAIHDLMHRYEPRFPEVTYCYRERDFTYKNICRYAKALLVDSMIGKQQVMESYLIDPGKIHILPYIAPRYIYNKDTPIDFEKKYTLPSKFIFYPAQFWEHKNHKGLIEAAALLKGTIPDLHLVFVGSRKEGFQNIQVLCKRQALSNNIHFLGYVPDRDMHEFYRRARAMIMPSYFGPTNIPPLEAIAVGCPVAISDVYGAQEQMRDAAIYFDPSSPQEIAVTIKRLWEDDHLCATLSTRGLTRSAQWNQVHFSEHFRKILEYAISK